MAKPYKEGTGWSMRRRILGQDLFVSGCRSAGAAKKKSDSLVAALESRGKPQGLGPQRTTFAQALQDYGVERLPFQKGAVQEANRINKFLRAGGLATLTVRRMCPNTVEPVTGKRSTGRVFLVSLEPPKPQRTIPQGLTKHRAKLASSTQQSDRLRERLARTIVADVTRHQVQSLMDAMRADGLEPATLQLERAVIRRLFNYAAGNWNWSAPPENPATKLTLPSVSNDRDRVMSADEEQRLDEAIVDCRNGLVGPTLTLLTQTAMRTSEPLEHARWGDVDWDQKILKLRDSKTDKRDVPLSPKAIDALKTLWQLNPGAPTDPIVRITYEALKAAWTRACERAGITGLRIHDLRHTAATRMALKTGNVFLVQALTGHKTQSQLARYVNVKAADVVAVMHAPEPVSEATQALGQRYEGDKSPGKVVKVDFAKRRMP